MNNYQLKSFKKIGELLKGPDINGPIRQIPMNDYQPKSFKGIGKLLEGLDIDEPTRQILINHYQPKSFKGIWRLLKDHITNGSLVPNLSCPSTVGPN